MNEYELQPIEKTLDDDSWDCTEYKGEDGSIVVVADSESQARFMCELATLKLIKRGLEHRGSPLKPGHIRVLENYLYQDIDFVRGSS